MATATANKPKQRDVLEFVAANPRGVDRASGIIRNVKILGHKSQNGHSYSTAAVKEARGLYEGSAVFVDHPARPDQERKVGEQIGWLEGVRSEADGLYGNLHLLKSHPLAAQVLEIAERRPDKIGLSHNAVVSESMSNGSIVFEAIHKVRSVDLVCRPATTRGIFESVRSVREEDGAAMLMTDSPGMYPDTAGSMDETTFQGFVFKCASIFGNSELTLARKVAKISELAELFLRAEEVARKPKDAALESIRTGSVEERFEAASRHVKGMSPAASTSCGSSAEREAAFDLADAIVGR